MDLAKLEKMKVVDLRNELQARGLDTKGVKAVLVERLRAHVEGSGAGGGDGDGTPVTPSRRQRRTRSMSRSPSPVAAAPVATEPELETLAEEEQPTEIVDDSEAEEAVETHAEADDYENEQEAVKASETDQSAEAGPLSEHEQDNDEDIRFQHNTAGEQNVRTESHESSEDAETGEPYKESGEQDQRATEVTVENGQKMDVDQEDNSEKGIDQDGDTAATSTHDQEQEKDKTDKADKPHDDSRSTSERRKRSHSHTRSRTGSRSPKRRSGDKRDSKVVEERSVPEDEPIIADKQVGLSWLDSDLHLRIDANNYTSAKPLNAEIYSLIWSGARANYGVREGKVCYEVRLSEESQPENSHHFRDEPHVRGFRVGFSTPKSSLLLGEAEHSYGYCESGRKASNSEFTEYGKPYQLDDVIGCYLDLDSTPCHIKYTLNGEDLGVAFEFDKSVLGEEDALFPHIVTKGYEYIVNFADGENLLVNAERPTRKRRKPRKESVKEDDEGEKWKVLDEATADDDELEKKDEKEEKPETEQGDAETVEEASESVVAENTEQSEKQQAESPTAMDTGEPDQNQNATNAEDEVKAADEPIGVINGDSEKRTEESAASEPSAAEQTEKSVEQADDDEEDGPSPNKRSKTDESEKEAASSVAAEDEYEDVVPLPRETAALLPGYVLIALVPVEQLIAGPQRAESRKECEVILLVGLPGAGKTHWTQKHVAENSEKRYEIIGPDAIIAKMTIDGASRKTVHKGRWDKVYEICLNSLGGLEDIAMKRRRNFILDQTNAYASAQRRKMKGFNDFKRIAVVCIPNEDELKRRIAEKEEKGNAFTVKESTINNLRANFTLPSLEFGWFDDIIYTELTGDEAKAEVKKYNEKGKKAIDADRSRDKRSRGGRDYRRDDRNRNRYGDDRRRDYGGQRNDSRWNDSRRTGGSYSSAGGASGGSRGYDNRNRGYPGGGGGGGGGGGQQNWMQNNRQRYDDRGYGGGAGGRGYDNRNRGYGGGGQQNWMQNNRQRGYEDRGYGGGGSSRDYRDRDRGNDRNRMGNNNDRNRGNSSGGGSSQSNYRSGGGNHQQRDFRPGHRDTKEDSRGGYERSAAQALPKYGNNSAMNAGYDQYKQSSGTPGGKSSLSGKWSTYAQHQQQQQTQQHQTGAWQQQQPMQQQYQQQQQQQTAGQQQYWGYNQMQGYGNQQAWQGADPQQQQQWMSWWPQQAGGAGGAAPASGSVSGSANAAAAASVSANNDGGAANHYWSQYSYSTQSNAGAEKK